MRRDCADVIGLLDLGQVGGPRKERFAYDEFWRI